MICPRNEILRGSLEAPSPTGCPGISPSRDSIRLYTLKPPKWSFPGPSWPGECLSRTVTSYCQGGSEGSWTLSWIGSPRCPPGQLPLIKLVGHQAPWISPSSTAPDSRPPPGPWMEYPEGRLKLRYLGPSQLGWRMISVTAW